MTPDEIRSREFARAPDGYDPGEVRRFLARVADEREAAGWAAVDERLLLVLQAAHRAVDSVAEDARRATAELRRLVREEIQVALDGRPAPAPVTAPAVPGPGPDVDHVRTQLEDALTRVEKALTDLGG